MTIDDLRFYFTLTDLNIRFQFTDNRKPLYVSAGSLPGERNETFNIMAAFSPDKEVDIVTNFRDSTGIRFIVAPYRSGFMQLGPYLLDEDPYPVQRPGNPLSMNLPIKTTEKIKSYNQLLSLRIQPEDLRNSSIKNIEIQDSVIESSVKINLEEIERRYGEERYIRQLISTGNKSEMREIFKDMSNEMDFKSRMPNNPLRVSKNMTIVLNSIGRLSAEKGGLPPFLLHSISEKFALKIEEQTNMKGINQLQREMLLNYCNAVHNYGIVNHSVHVVKACQYILRNLHLKLELKEIAENSNVHPSYLSRRFKEETGQTISSYIRDKRIMEARWMLSQTGETITDIALSLGFEDINYFSKVFRKERGISPSEYRKKIGNDDFDGIPG